MVVSSTITGENINYSQRGSNYGRVNQINHNFNTIGTLSTAITAVIHES